MRTWIGFIFLVFAPSAFGIPTQGQRMMVAGPSPYSTEIVQDIVKKGGNVIDAAVAVAMGLAVTAPYNASFGGGGFALVHMKGKPVTALDFREVAPQATNKTSFKDQPAKASVDGGLAVAVPGVPSGLWELHKKYGRLKWAQLFEQPLRLAKRGFRVSGEWVDQTKKAANRFNEAGKKRFFHTATRPLRPGDELKQPQLASFLQAFKESGPDAFYKGDVATDLVETIQRAGGVLTKSDLSRYQVRWLEPLTTQFNDLQIYLMPPPSSGGVVIKTALTMIEQSGLKKKAYLSVDELHFLAEILKVSFQGRSYLGDPAFTKNPIADLASPERIQPLSLEIKPGKLIHLKEVAFAEKTDPKIDTDAKNKESTETTHFSILDSDGNAIALTVTLNGSFGSAVVTEKFGIVLNNEMDDFTTRPGEPNMFGLIQGEANVVEPGKRPLSSMSPTLVTHEDRVILSLGSPGGPRIISAVLQVLYRHLVNGLDLDSAIQAPRIHHQFLPNITYVDPQRLSPEVLDRLKKYGHKIEESPVAKVFGISRSADGILSAAYDSRGEGGAGGF